MTYALNKMPTTEGLGAGQTAITRLPTGPTFFELGIRYQYLNVGVPLHPARLRGRGMMLLIRPHGFAARGPARTARGAWRQTRRGWRATRTGESSRR